MSVRSSIIKMVLAGPALALVLVAPASANHTDPDVYEAPKISGTAQVGKTLTASGGKVRNTWGLTISYQWLRCASATDLSTCAILWGATSTTYKLVEADRGRRMRVALLAYEGNVCDWTNPRDCDWMASTATASVAAAPAPTPTPTPTPKPPAATPTPTPKPPAPEPEPTASATPEPEPEPAPEPAPAAESFVLSASATSGPPARTKAAKRRKARMMRPFPTVRVSGRLTRTGADIQRLTVKAPKGARITLTCGGRGCPLREVAQTTARARKFWHIPQFERELRAGTRLTITVAKTGYVTKVTTITIRRGKAPARSDRCRVSDGAKLTRCPAR